MTEICHTPFANMKKVSTLFGQIRPKKIYFDFKGKLMVQNSNCSSSA